MSKFKSCLVLTVFAFSALVIGSNSVRAQTTGNNPNVIYACYQKNSGDLRKVSGPGQCRNSELEVRWNTAGVPGSKGDKGDKGDKGEPGQSVTSEVIPLNDSRCLNGVGGVQYTDSTGVRVVCNGQKGDKGDTGEAGSGSGGGSEIFYTKMSDPSSFTLSPVSTTDFPTGFVEIGTLTLPEGSYLVSARASLRYFPGSGVTDRSDIICKLNDGTLDQEIRVNLTSPPPPGTSDFPVSGTLPITFGTGGGVVHWACSANPKDTNHGVTASTVQIWAVKASTLHIQ